MGSFVLPPRHFILTLSVSTRCQKCHDSNALAVSAFASVDERKNRKAETLYEKEKKGDTAGSAHFCLYTGASTGFDLINSGLVEDPPFPIGHQPHPIVL